MARLVSFHLGNERLVTDWISGVQTWLNMSVTFDVFLSHVEEKFSIKTPRAYVLQSTTNSWRYRIRLTAENFNDFQRKRGMFSDICKLYVCGNESPTHTPVQSPDRRIDDHDGSQGTNRSGQTEFNASIIRRDEGKCVFCGSTDVLEAAHILPVESKHVLQQSENRALYCIDSINDSCNGITLCWGCHKCFDANLVCIDPITHTLLVTDALLANEREKFSGLVGAKVSPRFSQWPKQVLQFRMDAMETATQGRRDKHAAYEFFCSICNKGYKRLASLKKHEEQCDNLRKTPAMYHTPAGKASGAIV